MTLNSQNGLPILPRRHTHIVPRRVLAQIGSSYRLPLSEHDTSDIVSLRASTSCASTGISFYTKKNQNHKTSRPLSVLSYPDFQEKKQVPTKALEINDMINKKNYVLRIKHKVKDGSEPVPNILEIKQSVKKEEISFMRRMDKKLNTTGNAFLLNHLKQDLHIQSHNYLKEALEKTRRNRKYLINTQRSQKTDSFVVFQCQLAKDNVSIS